MENTLCYKGLQSHQEIASVKLSPAKLDSLRAPYMYALHGKVLFKKIRIDRLYYHLIRIWSPDGTIKIHELGNDFFVIVFSDPLDYLKVVRSGPWMIAGHYITLKPFSFNFKPQEAIITTIPIWIRLPDYPIELYDVEVFELIAKALGGFLVKIHRVTEEHVRVRFAQLCVEVDVSKPLSSYIEICGVMQRVEYVGLEFFLCGLCRRVGHLSEDCVFSDAQPDLASFEYGPWLRGESKETLVRGSVPVIESLYTDDSSGSSSDLIRQASTRYLQPGEGTSSTMMDDQMHIYEEKLDLSNTWEETKARNSCSEKMRLTSKKEDKPPTFARFLGNSSNSKPSISVQTNTIQNESLQREKTRNLNPSSPPYHSKGFEVELASYLYTEYVKKSAKHREISAKSILLTEQSEEAVIFTTAKEVSSIQARFSISPITSGKASIKVTPNVVEKDISISPIPTNSTNKILCWTCGGADDTKVAKAIDDLIETHNPSIVFLSHTSTSGFETCQVKTNSKFSGSFFINPVGDKGGMWLMWRKEEVKVEIESAALTHIQVTVYFSAEPLV